MQTDAPTKSPITREKLIYFLTEAAEIEHGLMCCYLYAAWSLKDDKDGLPPEQMEAVARWRRSITSIAVEEMTHLVLVNNLLVALGASPHLMRPNFPVGAGYHPSNMVVALAPFDLATLDHFLFLERPEKQDIADSDAFRPELTYQRGGLAGRINPTAQDYDTVGELYRLIEHSLEDMTAQIGEAALFVGDPEMQICSDLAPIPGIARVKNLATAISALETIITQGEGSTSEDPSSHFVRFCAIRTEYVALLGQDPSFVPAHPAARNPVLRRPPFPEGKVFIQNVEAARVGDVAAALYGLMLRAQHALWTLRSDDPQRRPALALSMVAMRGLTTLGEKMARMKAFDEAPCNAGFPFTISRSFALAFIGPDAGRLLAERAEEIVAALRTLDPAFAHLADQLADAAARARGETPPPRVVAKAPVAPELVAASAQDDAKVDHIVGRDLEIVYRGARCIHHRHCVLNAPETFLANTPGDWIFPDATPTEQLVAVAQACVSGAIRYRRLDGGAEEPVPPVNAIRLRENGPLGVTADLKLVGHEDQIRATLCRCGQSQNKPFCDGSHNAAGFVATGEPASIKTDALAKRDGALAVRPLANGPLEVTGNVEICCGTGRIVLRTDEVKLCRCGGSSTKPVCDGTHIVNGFRAPGVE